jgi:YidC/Oxa1 family membrane protein insertase
LQDNKRIIVAALISVIVLFAWQELVVKPQQKVQRPDRPDAGAVVAAPDARAPAAPAPAAVAAPVAAPAPSAREELATLETDEFRAIFTSHGGALKELTLKGRKFRRQQKGGGEEPVNLVKVGSSEPYPLSLALSPELGGGSDLASDPSARTPMSLVEHGARGVTFEGRVGALNVRKRFTISDTWFEIGGEVSLSGVERPGSVVVLYPSFLPPEAPTPGFFSGGEVFETVAPMCRAGGKTERFGGKEALQKVPGTASWVGLDHHYFVSALMPAQPEGECFLGKGRSAGASFAGLRLPVQQSASFTFKLYVGPKRLDLLRSYGRDLDTAIDYGSVTNLFAFFARILLWLMQRFHDVVGNWGVAIILLTVLVKLLLYPLTVKQMRSMQEMRKLQPEIEKLKAQHGEDKEKLNLAVMQLYQQHKVNPLGGCLPLLFQMPIWLALYATLQTAVELYREPFLWVKDLTQYDPIYVLPLAMGLTSFITQKISPQPADNAQAKMLLYFMPVFFTFIMLKLPAGLTLYILVNNLLSIAQQQWMMRRELKPEPAKA